MELFKLYAHIYANYNQVVIKTIIIMLYMYIYTHISSKYKYK